MPPLYDMVQWLTMTAKRTALQKSHLPRDKRSRAWIPLAEIAILKFVCRDIGKNLQNLLVFRSNLSGRVKIAAGALRRSSIAADE